MGLPLRLTPIDAARFGSIISHIMTRVAARR